MNILYLAKLTGNPWAGTYICVLQQIYAQSKIDNVLWLNLNHIKQKEWEKDTYIFHNLDSIKPRLDQLPVPFNHPDLVIVQQSYNNPFSKIIADIQKKQIPYIIKPHGEYNLEAQKHHRIKKIIGNLLYFNRMIKKSMAIEYLTENEQRNSMCKGKKYVIVPNGISLPDQTCLKIPSKTIHATFIGRLSIFHKGLDVLLNAIALIKTDLENVGFRLNLYGPNQEGAKEVLNKLIIEKKMQQLVSVNDGVCGNEKNAVLQATNLFVLTSRFEGHPIALLEALSHGIPCLVTPGTNMDKMVSKYNAGWCTEFDAVAISKSLQAIVKSVEWSEKSRNARKLASVYSWDAIAQKAHEEYEKMLKKHYSFNN